MIKKRLHSHPAFPHPDLTSFDVFLNFKIAGDLILHYEMNGALEQLIIPDKLPVEKRDNLWEHTCFEAFIAVEGDTGYLEYNFSPSSHWASYAFSNYRVRRDWTLNEAPVLEIMQMPKRLVLTAALSPEMLPPNPHHLPLNIGISAVLEAQDGSLSYWALNHPLDHPDFHHQGGFNAFVNHKN